MSTSELSTVAANNNDAIGFAKNTGRNSIAKGLLAFIHGLDAEFPLSGGETNGELRKNIQYLEHEGSVFLHSADGNFPLTGA